MTDGDSLLDGMDVKPFRFYDVNMGWMAYIYPDTKHHFAGWILRKTKGGDWITVRKATADDLKEMDSIVVKSHHGASR